MMLESLKHEQNSFVTLTYSPEHYPSDGSLVPKHTQDFLKRLRKAVAPLKIRYYLVGEYGDQSQRAHYHAAIFGLGPSSSSLIQQAWGLGHTLVGDLTVHSAQYICGYVTKKMTRKDDPVLNGRYPEFARMSLKPGIGAVAISDIGDALFTEFGISEVMATGDVPRSLRHGGRVMPLGRYLRSKLRDEIGMTDDFKKKNDYRYSVEMCALFKDALSDPKNQAKSFRQILIDKNVQKVRNLESKTKLYEKGKTL